MTAKHPAQFSTLAPAREQPVWGYADLAQLRDAAAAGLSLAEMAAEQSDFITAQDCDLALWAMTGRTISEAVAFLGSRA